MLIYKMPNDSEYYFGFAVDDSSEFGDEIAKLISVRSQVDQTTCSRKLLLNFDTSTVPGC